MADPAHVVTDKEIKRIERELRREYTKAERELTEKLDDYFRRFEIKDRTWQRWVAEGKKTQREYKNWRMGQIAVGKRWEKMRDAVASDLAHVNQHAMEIAYGHSPTVYAENFNFGTYQSEHGSGMDTSFTLYNHDTVARLKKENPKLLPDPGEKKKKEIAEGKAVKYNKRLLQSALTQAIVQGESIPKLAQRLMDDVGEKDYKAAVRNARTMMTSAQNAARLDSYRRAADMGIKQKKRWLAAHDGRTRHWHAELDEVVVPLEEPFVNEYGEIMYPGDFGAEPANVYNCRCTMVPVYEGYETKSSVTLHRDTDIEGMSYEEWKQNRKTRSDPIEKQTKIAQNMKGAWISQYRGYSVANDKDNGNIRNRNRIGEPVEPTEKTLDSALNKQQYAYDVAGKYGINLRGSGKNIAIEVDESIASIGRTRKENPLVITLGSQAFVSEEELANTIAHELNHCRSFLKGGNAPERSAYDAGDALAEYIRGER